MLALGVIPVQRASTCKVKEHEGSITRSGLALQEQIHSMKLRRASPASCGCTFVLSKAALFCPLLDPGRLVVIKT